MLNREWLKTARILLMLSQEEVAKKMFTNKQTISNLETGKSKQKMSLAFYELTLLNIIENDPEKERVKRMLSSFSNENTKAT